MDTSLARHRTELMIQHKIFHMRNMNSRKKSITAISMVVFNTFLILIKELNKPEDKERKVPFWVTWK